MPIYISKKIIYFYPYLCVYGIAIYQPPMVYIYISVYIYLYISIYISIYIYILDAMVLLGKIISQWVISGGFFSISYFL